MPESWKNWKNGNPEASYKNMGEHQGNLTTGNVRKKLIVYALPLVLTSVLQALYSIADLVIAGQFIGKRSVSAINNSSQIMNLLTQAAVGLTLGGNILIGQYFGNGSHKERKMAGGTLFFVSLLFGAVSGIIIFLTSGALLEMLGVPAMEESIEYLHICAGGCLFILGYNALSSIMRGTGNSRVPFLCIFSSILLNVILDICFVVLFKMGIKGVAYATVFAQAVSFVTALAYTWKHQSYYGFYLKNFKIRVEKLWAIMKLGVPCVLQNTVAGISWLTVTYFINQYGVDVSAGNGISIKIKEFSQLFITSMSGGAATMIAQNLGAGQFERARETMNEGMKICLVMAGIVILVIEISAPWLVSLFTKDPNVVSAAVMNLRIEIIGQIFYAMFLNYHSLMTGAGHTMYVFMSSFVNCILVRIVLAGIFNHLIGLNGVYLACLIAPSVSVPIGYLYTKSGIWKKDRLLVMN